VHNFVVTFVVCSTGVTIKFFPNVIFFARDGFLPEFSSLEFSSLIVHGFDMSKNRGQIMLRTQKEDSPDIICCRTK